MYSKVKTVNLSLLILQFTLFTLLFAGVPDTLWTRVYGGKMDEGGYSVQQTTDGGFVIAGYTWSYSAGGVDIYLLRINPNGDTLWTKSYGGIYNDEAYSIRQTSDGGFIITGSTILTQQGITKTYLLRTDADGDTLWTKTYGDSSHITTGHSVQQVSDDGFIIAGISYHFSENSQPHSTLTDFYLIRTDSEGDTLWTKTYGGDKQDNCFSVQQTSDGGFIIGGYTTSFGAGGHDIYMIHTDSIGDTLWTKTYGSPREEQAKSFLQISDGGFIILGSISDTSGRNADIYAIRTNADGDTLWTKTYGGDDTDEGCSIHQTSDEGFIIGGGTISSGKIDYDVYCIRTDPSGDTLWTWTFGGDSYDLCKSVQQTNDGGFIIAGSSNFVGTVYSQVYLIRLDKETTEIQDDNPNNYLNPNNFILSYNTNNLISVRYTIQYSSSVNLSMYNISGQLVKTFFNEYKNAGDYTINMKPDNIIAGVYYLKLSAGESRYTQKAVVIK